MNMILLTICATFVAQIIGMADKEPLQNRKLEQAIVPQEHPRLLQENYRWEQIGKESGQTFKRSHGNTGRILWQQLPGNKQQEPQDILSLEYIQNHPRPVTFESLQQTKSELKEKAKNRFLAYQEAERAYQELANKEVFQIITPIAALTSLQTQQTNCRTYLELSGKTLEKMDSKINSLKKTLPLELQQLRPDIRANLFTLLQIQNKQEATCRQKEKEEARLKQLMEQEEKELTLLQNGIINFDRNALNDEMLLKRALVEKRKRAIEEDPTLHASEIKLTHEEYTTYVYNYRRDHVLDNLNKQQLAIVQKACPQIIKPIEDRPVVTKFKDEKELSKPSAQKESSDTEEEENFDSLDQPHENSSSPYPSSSSSSSSSSSNGFFNWSWS